MGKRFQSMLNVERNLSEKNYSMRKWNEGKFGACGLFAKALLNQISLYHAGRPKPYSWGPEDVRHFC